MAGWRTGRKDRAALRAARSGDLREFVYLDDMSVYSLLASRRGPVPTDFTQSETASMTAELGSSAALGLGPAQTTTAGKLQRVRSTTSEVVRKSSAQARFKQLLDEEQEKLKLRCAPRGAAPDLVLPAELDDATSSRNDWVVNPWHLERGDMVEIEIQLEADPAFKLAEVIKAFTSMTGDPALAAQIGPVAGVEEAAALAGLLDQLLDGLVPIRARAVSYVVVTDLGRDMLVHTSVLRRLTPGATTRPLWVTGFADESLFTKDHRRVLFGGGRFNAMCRLSADGIADDWNPIVLADVLDAVDPSIGQQMRDMGRGLLPAVREAATNRHDKPLTLTDMLRVYADLWGEHLGVEISEDRVPDVTIDVQDVGDPPFDRVALRPLFKRVDGLVEEATGNPVDPVVAAQLRSAAWGTRARTSNETPHFGGEREPEGILAVEFIGIYW